MAVTTCTKCEGHTFELSLFTPVGQSTKLAMIQCSICGTAVGAVDMAAIAQIGALKSQVAAIDEKLSRIAQALQD